MKEYVDPVMEELGIYWDDKTEAIIIEKAKPAERPVIVMQTEDDGYLPVLKNEVLEEGTKETEEEKIWDDDNKIYSLNGSLEDEISLVFAGDICFHDAYSNMGALRERGNGIYDCILPEVMEELKKADIFMVNNEFPYSDRGTPLEGKQYAFRSKPSNVNLLHDMGVDIVSLANNHAYDHGPDALIDTIDILKNAGIPFVGAGKNIDEAVKPVYFKINGFTLAYTAATQIERVGNPDTKEATADSPGVLRTLDPSKYIGVIQEADANSDFCIAYVHWGSENTDLVEQSQKELAMKFAAAGADLIIGDHSHCLQGFDYVDGVPVLYSLGNFWFNSKTVDTGFLRVVLDNTCNISSLQFIPCVQENCKTRIAEEEKKISIINYMRGISGYAQIDENGFVIYSSENHNIQNGKNTSPSAKKEEVVVE
ncbi:MAG: CapA family protein [Lachnospiraceae bacterium]|nr:CapA family protein [Lachnospiraceae bacterium]